jgi:hypothetical protein
VESCRRINPSGPAPLLRRSRPSEDATWIELPVYYRRRSGQAIEQRFRYMTFLDSEHVRILTKIDDSGLFAHVDMLASQSVSNTDLTLLAEALFGYYRLTRQLQQYADRHLKGLAWAERRE